MRISTFSALAGAGAPLILSSAASGTFLGVTGAFVPNEFGLVVCRVYATFNRLGDHMNAAYGNSVQQLTINVVDDPNVGGVATFFQSASGGDTPPQPSVFDGDPAARYDTYVTVGVLSFNSTSPGVPEGQIANNLTLTPTWPGFTPQQLRLTGDAWAILPDAPQGDPFGAAGTEVFPGDGKVLIAQLSTADGLGFTGTVNVRVITDGDVLQYGLPFSCLIPAPGAIGIAAVAGVIGPRRRRRRH